jgi:hypothetical protein
VKNKLLLLILCTFVKVGYSQLTSYASYSTLFTDNSIYRNIDVNKSVNSVPLTLNVNEQGALIGDVPIYLPPGTGGMQPSVSLSYNSMAGSGIAGKGWNISGLSVISRSGADYYHDNRAAPVTHTNDDFFVLDGMRLVPLSGSNGANGTTYATESESYSIVTSYGNIGNGPEKFTVITKDGTKMEYGHSADARLLTDDYATVMLWRLNWVQDVNGNYIQYIYSNSERDSRLIEILYTGNVNTSLYPYNSI